MLEREGALAFWLLVPTLALLTLFIAYPFVRGVWLSLTNHAGRRPEFVVNAAALAHPRAKAWLK